MILLAINLRASFNPVCCNLHLSLLSETYSLCYRSKPPVALIHSRCPANRRYTLMNIMLTWLSLALNLSINGCSCRPRQFSACKLLHNRGSRAGYSAGVWLGRIICKNDSSIVEYQTILCGKENTMASLSTLAILSRSDETWLSTKGARPTTWRRTGTCTWSSEFLAAQTWCGGTVLFTYY